MACAPAALAVVIVGGFDAPPESPVRLARSDETDAFEYADGRGILRVTPRDNHPHMGLAERPLNERTSCFGGISAAAPIRNHAVADLHSAIGTWRPSEADITDHRRRFSLDNHPYAEGFIGAAGRSLQRQYV